MAYGISESFLLPAPSPSTPSGILQGGTGLVRTRGSRAWKSAACAPLEGMRAVFHNQFPNLVHDAKGLLCACSAI